MTTPLSRREFLKLSGLSLVVAPFLPSCALPPQPADVSLEVKIGQMLMVGFRGLVIDEGHPIIRDITDHYLGGVVLFDFDVPNWEAVRNIASPIQVQVMIETLQRLAYMPLLVAIDHEGGIITRLKERYGFPASVSHQQLGDTNDLDYTHQQAAEMAQTLRELGINLNLAPVVDVNTNPDNPIIANYERSFSADPQQVTTHAAEFIKAHHEQGVLSTLKHFPGHGSSTEDSHIGVTDVTETWSRIELEPYRNLIEAGQVDAIMTAHVFNATLDNEDPATLSPAVITDLLRGELQYDGVVISDDMQMGAIREHYGFETALQKTIEAGVDIVAIANNSVYEPDIVARSARLIRQWVDDGTVSEARIDESYQRIQRLKQRL
ncbi:MAG: glycoside hydrolase family 3 N-terminal domain-containing protein [Chloroflexota bacterium]